MDNAPLYGAPRVMYEVNIRALTRNIIREPTSTSGEHLTKLKSANIYISKDIMAKYIKKLGFDFYIKACKSRLMTDNQVKRLRWAKDKVN
jgi:hypothetical protein